MLDVHIIIIVLSFDDLVKSTPIDSADIRWKVGVGGSYFVTNITFNAGNYEVELWLRHSEFEGYGSFTIYLMINKTHYYNQTETLDINIIGLTVSNIDSPAQDQTFYSNETLLLELSFDDSVKATPISGAQIEWKVGNTGTYTSIGVSYPGTGNYPLARQDKVGFAISRTG